MIDLDELQSRMAHAILNRNFDEVAAKFVSGQAQPKNRLNIFANNTYVSLKTSLKAVFPVTVLLADERFFDFAADVFVRHHPPMEARLARFGGGFPRFLAGFAPCKDYPIIAQMAAFEWAVADMMNAPQLAPAPVSDLTGLPLSSTDPVIVLQPNLRFAISDWPLVQIWSEHRSGQSEPVPVTARCVTRMAMTRETGDVRIFTLEPARFAFWRALARGRSVRSAAMIALSRDRLFDLVHEVALLFRLRLATEVSIT